MSEQNEDIIESQDELAALKARADLMGISYHPSIGLEKLRAKVTAAIEGKPDGETTESPEPSATKTSQDETKETPEQRRARMRDEALKLVRIRVACMNPNKKEWEGEIITAGNAGLGTVKKYVPFNAEEGWHVPHIIYEQLLHRECQIFVTVRDPLGNQVRRAKLIKEFAIEVLPPLSEEELKDLAIRQAMSKSID